jgi:hypothetical protein
MANVAHSSPLGPRFFNHSSIRNYFLPSLLLFSSSNFPPHTLHSSLNEEPLVFETRRHIPSYLTLCFFCCSPPTTEIPKALSISSSLRELSLQAPRGGRVARLKLKQKLNEKPPSDIGEHVRRQVTRNKRGELVTDPPQIYRHCATP